MGGENKAANTTSSDDQLAKDVARLYAWANVEGVPYRDFSRQRKVQQKPVTSVAEEQTVETISTHVVVESEVTATAVTRAPIPEQPPAIETTIQPTVQHAAAPTSGLPVVFDEPVKSVPVASDAAPAPRPLEPESPYTPSRVRSRSRFIDQLTSPVQSDERPILAVHSLAGGVGKSTLCANVARVLCSLGEQILMVDASGSGLLPFHFGANDLRSGLRKFVAPGMTYSPLRVIGAEEITAGWLDGDVRAAMAASDRVIFDLGPASFGLLPNIFGLANTILVPLLPDLNSILTIPRIEASLEKMRSSGLKVPPPFYVFSEFDSESSIDQRARELVAGQCGERLLPLTIRHGAEVGQAIASRITVVDHAPESEVTHDYVQLAGWLQSVAPVRRAAKSSVRWTEQ
jgi:cellulose biosynthesis protein BcsQ